MINLHNTGGEEGEENQTPVIVLKIVSILVILIMTLIFGCLPYFWYITLI